MLYKENNFLYRLDRILICAASYQLGGGVESILMFDAQIYTNDYFTRKRFVFDVFADSKCLLAVSILRLLARHGLQYNVNVVITAVSSMYSQ